MPTTFKIDNEKLKNTMEGECDPTGNKENSGIIKEFFHHSTPVSIHNEIRSSNFYLAR